MKRLLFYFFIFFFVNFTLLLISCGDSHPADVYNQLETKAQINTFPLTIVTSDKLEGDFFPEDIRNFCTFSATTCKALPIAGIYRLGLDLYYPYTNVSELNIADSKDAVSITKKVEQHVSAYLSKTALKDYDSLSIPNRAVWDIKTLFLSHINTITIDSVLFFSDKLGSPSIVTIDNHPYHVYNSSHKLREKINELICKGQKRITVYYNPLFESLGNSITISDWLDKGVRAGDTCIGYAKYEKLHDGKGGFIPGNFIDSNSKDCGYEFSKLPAGDTFDFVYPTGVAGDTCIDGSKYIKFHDGNGGYLVGTLIEQNSRACNYLFPSKGTYAEGFIIYKGSKYEKLHDGKGGYMRGGLIESNASERAGSKNTVSAKSKNTEPVKPKNTAPAKSTSSEPKPKAKAEDNRCARKSEPLCEQDNSGNYTGRRVQYCYNKNGGIIKTIVIAKCDDECRCF